MKNIISIMILLLLMLLNSCGKAYRAVSFTYRNFSEEGKVIKNVKANWNGIKIGGAYNLEFCAMNINIYDVRNFKDLFAPIQIEWINEKGKRVKKDLIISKSVDTNNNFYAEDIYIHHSE